MRLRRFSQLFGLLLSEGYLKGFIDKTIYTGGLKGICNPGLNCYACPGALFACPIGTIQHFVVIRQIPLYVLGYLATVGTVFGRGVCGWFCPFGFFQDLLYSVRTTKFSLPRQVGYGKYLILAGLVVIVPFVTLEPWFSKLCPCGTLVGGLPWIMISGEIRDMAHAMFYLKVAILFVIAAASVMTKRPFCRMLCPLGAIYSFFNRFSVFQLVVDQGSCTKCGRCRDLCPMEVKIWERPTDIDCIRCLDCTTCPSITLVNRMMKSPAILQEGETPP
jgi:polyferredoxin